MPSVTDLAAYKHHRSLQQVRASISELTHRPIAWCFKPDALEFMRVYGVMAPDLLNILRTASKFDFQADGCSFVIRGCDTEGTDFALQLVLYPEAMKIKVVKAWKVSRQSQIAS